MNKFKQTNYHKLGYVKKIPAQKLNCEKLCERLQCHCTVEHNHCNEHIELIEHKEHIVKVESVKDLVDKINAKTVAKDEVVDPAIVLDEPIKGYRFRKVVDESIKKFIKKD